MALSAARKMQILRVARLVRRGQAIGHTTSTIPGIAALPNGEGVQRVQRFKGRNGPFLLLAASCREALRLARYISPALRREAATVWPGATTLIFPARPGLPRPLYLKGMLAVRVDADAGVRQLARACGGLLLSSSLNKKKALWHDPNRVVRMRWHRYFSATEAGGAMSGAPSRLIRVRRRSVERLR